MINKPSFVIAALFLVQAPAVSAQTGPAPDLSLDGFGTVGVVHSDEEQADFIADVLAPDGVGHTRAWSAEVDSRLGIQLTADFTSRISAVAQMVVEQRYDDSYTPLVEWANLSYEATPDLKVRAGRTVLPIFMISGYRKVGYANPWVRPPPEVYRIVPITNADGVDLTHRSRFGQFTNTLRAVYGIKKTDIADFGELEARDVMTLSNTLEVGSAKFFASYGQARLTWDEFDPLFNGFRQFGDEGEAIADRYDVDNKRFKVATVGTRYDRGDWFVMAELARSKSRTFISDIRGSYITAGYRFGTLTPYVTLADLRIAGETSDPGLSPPPNATAEELNARLERLLGITGEQQSLAIGTRWDVARSVAIKFQFDYIDLEPQSSGVLGNEQPGFRRGGAVRLFTAALDFVF